MNVAVHGRGLERWALTERTRSAVHRDASHVAIGASSMRRMPDGTVIVDVDERSSPWGSRIRGRITLTPRIEHHDIVTLDDAGEHDWCPRIPLARVEVDLVEPRLRFRGTGYLDENSGARPLDTAFRRWSWSRVASEDAIAIAYDVELRDRAARSHGVRLSPSGITPFVPNEHVDLGRTRFALPRRLRGGGRLVRTVEDGPFYARSVVETTLDGAPAYGMHETVCLERFGARWVQFLLPFRMRVEAA